MEQNNMFVPEWNNPLSEERNEVVFENKNKNYGAYILRKNYAKNILVGFCITALTITLLTLIPLINAWFKPVSVQKKSGPVVVEVELKDIPPEPEEQKIVEIKFPKLATVQATELAPSKDPVEEIQTNFNDKDLFGKKNQEGQEDPLPEKDYLGTDNITGKVDHKKFREFKRDAVFPGDLSEFFAQNVNVPEDIISGKVMVSFVVNEQGKVTDIKLEKGLNESCNKEALRLVSIMPKWKPAIQNGNPARFPVVIPFDFSLFEGF